MMCDMQETVCSDCGQVIETFGALSFDWWLSNYPEHACVYEFITRNACVGTMQ